jgi:hypothetical protein
MTEHEMSYAVPRRCRCGISGPLQVWAEPSDRYPGRYEAQIICLSCDRRGAPGYSRYRDVATRRARRHWDVGKMEDA